MILLLLFTDVRFSFLLNQTVLSFEQLSGLGILTQVISQPLNLTALFGLLLPSLDRKLEVLN